ncbi:60S acidic ribosomal protein P1-like [Hibiscus syriacus]|uniref:60S acidic ribosomal protein P1-like n=1 Tax=Hibiscus syriacus TaxID=106335 RepID=UPI001920FB98|nr:60S acidic ribosomal protein P1-like [Hibiscus syriacus]
MATVEIACTYAALILHDDGIPATAEKIATLVEAANVSVESYWPSLFAKFLERSTSIAPLWVKAMKDEIQALESNHT